MLIHFQIENLLSFDEPACLSMVPAPRQRLHKHHVVDSSSSTTFPLLRCAVVYGANASGKSNLVRAMSLISRLIANGTSTDDPIYCPRYKLVNDRLQRPARCEFAFRAAKQQYKYTIAFDQSRIHFEQLRRLSATDAKRSNEPLFTREAAGDSFPAITFGPSLKNKLSAKDREFLDFVARGTRPNQPFLTEARERNVTFFIDAYKWFSQTLTTIWPESKPPNVELQVRKDADFKHFLRGVLASASSGITRIDTIQRPLEDVDLPEQLKTHLHQDLNKQHALSMGSIKDGSERRYFVRRDDQGALIAEQLVTVHEHNGQTTHFELEEESAGTRRLIELSAVLWELVKGERDRVFVIDEVDSSLHPSLLEMLLKLYLDYDEDPTNSQLIMTTHQTNLLDLELLRKDEIWFVEKMLSGSSDLYSLADFELRYDKDIRKDYLLGRYGAIPYIGNYASLTNTERLDHG